MKFVHVADLHIGKRVNGMSMLDDQRHILAQIAAIARDEEADALVVAGDIYDKASPSAEAVTVLDAFLSQLARQGTPVLAVPGNHDSAERIAFAQGLLRRQGVNFPPVYEGELRSVTLEDDHGPVVFWLLPFLKPGDVRRFFPERDIGDSYAEALKAALSTCDINPDQRNVAISHQLVTYAGTAPDRAEEEIKLGGIDNVDVSVYQAFDYVALGHVHRPQRVGRDTVRYAGSPLKYSFGEARYAKSAVVVDMGPKAPGSQVGECVDFRLVPLEPLHDMREVRASLQDLLAAPDAEEAQRDYLHVTLTDQHPQLDAMARIRAVYPNVMTLDYDRAAASLRAASYAAAVDPDAVDPVELFARFYEEQVEQPLDDDQRETVKRLVAEAAEWHARGGMAGGAR